MDIEYRSCPVCHQPSSVAHGKCYACGTMVADPPIPARAAECDGNQPIPAVGTAEAVSQTQKRPFRLFFGWFFLVIGMVMMVFFGFIFNSKLIYLNQMEQAFETMGAEITSMFQGHTSKKPSQDDGWFLDPGQVQENGMRLGMVFWISGMMCILLPKRK